MFGNLKDLEATQNVGFLLLPQFSMMAFTSSVEPLRAANRMSERILYNWKIFSMDGGPVQASNGVTITPDSRVTDSTQLTALFVCAGLKPFSSITKELCSTLRNVARAGVAMGSVCTGTLALAEAGLLEKYCCTIHWENVEGFVETYPNLDVTAKLFQIDRDRYTCSGGTAPIDMMIHSITLDHGEQLAMSVAEQLLHNYTRQPNDDQRMSLQHRTGITNPKLLAAIAYMEAYTETPMPLPEVAKNVSISLRQLERLFKASLNTTPAKYYLEIRLQRARLLLQQTSTSVMQIAVATGFTSAAHFTQAYRSCFGYPPSSERIKPQKK